MAPTASPPEPILGTTVPPPVPLTTANALQFDRMIAARDAGIIVEAMKSSLDWMAYCAISDDAHGRENNVMFESIEVCRRLMDLLSGAIGCCDGGTSDADARMGSVPLFRLVHQMQEWLQRSAGSRRVLLPTDPTPIVAVRANPTALLHALSLLVQQTIAHCSCDSTVKLAVWCSGCYAVLNIAVDRVIASEPELEAAGLEEATFAVDSALEREHAWLLPVATALMEQRGFLDVEFLPDGKASLYVVVPTDEVLSGFRATSISQLEVQST